MIVPVEGESFYVYVDDLTCKIDLRNVIEVYDGFDYMLRNVETLTPAQLIKFRTKVKECAKLMESKRGKAALKVLQHKYDDKAM